MENNEVTNLAHTTSTKSTNTDKDIRSLTHKFKTHLRISLHKRQIKKKCEKRRICVERKFRDKMSSEKNGRKRKSGDKGTKEIPEKRCKNLVENFVTTGNKPPTPLGYQSSVCNVFYPHKNKLILKPWDRKKIKTGLIINTHGKYYTTTSNAPQLLAHGAVIAPTTLDCCFNGKLCISAFNLTNKPITIKHGHVIAQLKFVKEPH